MLPGRETQCLSSEKPDAARVCLWEHCCLLRAATPAPSITSPAHEGREGRGREDCLAKRFGMVGGCGDPKSFQTGSPTSPSTPPLKALTFSSPTHRASREGDPVPLLRKTSCCKGLPLGALWCPVRAATPAPASDHPAQEGREGREGEACPEKHIGMVGVVVVIPKG